MYYRFQEVLYKNGLVFVRLEHQHIHKFTSQQKINITAIFTKFNFKNEMFILFRRDFTLQLSLSNLYFLIKNV